MVKDIQAFSFNLSEILPKAMAYNSAQLSGAVVPLSYYF